MYDDKRRLIVIGYLSNLGEFKKWLLDFIDWINFIICN